MHRWMLVETTDVAEFEYYFASDMGHYIQKISIKLQLLFQSVNSNNN